MSDLDRLSSRYNATSDKMNFRPDIKQKFFEKNQDIGSLYNS